MKGITGEVLLQLCESRLDNVVFRIRISPQEVVQDNWFLTDILL